MEFISASKFDSPAEEFVWNQLKEAFEDEVGYCWHNHPVTGISGNFTAYPDIIILHPDWGLIVIEVKGCHLNQIETIEGQTWYMTDWYEREMEPVYQARRHMFTIIDRMKD